jgi:uncharacterized protein
MDKVLKAIHKNADEGKLFSVTDRDPRSMFHRKMRLAAMLHDIGTFPFSHSIEHGYISHSKRQIAEGKSQTLATHEELGSHVINHTDFPGGLTHILKAGGFNPQEISDIIRGKSDNALANQLMHSDIDADRIDYLLRDAHHTGVKYGVFDMDYLVSNMRACKHGKGEVLAVNESAMTVVEYFLISRYSWYTQIVQEGTGYKFDLLATRIAQYFVETGITYTFEELKKLASSNPKAFFGFNDSYFTFKLQEALQHGVKGAAQMSSMISEMIEMLMFRIPPRQIRVGPFASSLVTSQKERGELIVNIHNAVEWLREQLKNVPNAWVIEDIPAKDVIFTKNGEALKKNGKNRLDSQESVKIVDRSGNLRLLVDTPNSLLRILSTYQNFMPRVYVSRNTYKYLQSKGLLAELERLFPVRIKPPKKISA